MPTKKPKKPAKRVNWKEACVELAKIVVFHLKFYKEIGRPGGSGMMIDFKTNVSTPWQERSFDALDKIGYCIDRKAYYANINKKKRRR